MKRKARIQELEVQVVKLKKQRRELADRLEVVSGHLSAIKTMAARAQEHTDDIHEDLMLDKPEDLPVINHLGSEM